ncbi:pyruvate carboxylase [Chytriomyces confervae]|uniref:Pyruvate carboxylase n=1 Tax=Chytriomyces confervae TaxID=246404 RepID=A0A507F366_9FUNG|nr:pyruvate carboxylase [Chytriomyces confervae]
MTESSSPKSKRARTQSSEPKPRTLLAANRGEIALRIIRAGRELNMNCIAIYSFEDRLSMHRTRADKAYQIGSPETHSPVGAYLSIPDIIAIARTKDVTAIHPGYGFLSENPQFSRACAEAGIAFVGPPANVIESCGDKTKARTLAINAGVSVVPGSDGPIKTVADAEAFARAHGLPIIIKAANGGGGRGMRVVRDMESLPSLFERAKSESLSAFGDDTLFIEKLIERPRHIEVQILADAHGNVVHLFERDCSVQRRHQKVVEYGPSFLPNDARKRLFDDAIKLAKAVGYVNAGTVEFLVDANNNHYFIEINPRVQVEHCVTEEITGIDIVASQIEIALGKTLPELGLTQEKISMRGFAIQCRITAENPSQNFQPDSGRISMYRSPGGNGIRLDGGPCYAGAIISPHYDSLLVKCITVGRDYQVARRKMLSALSEFRVRGIHNNIDWLMKLLTNSVFAAGGKVWTTFIDDTPELFKDFEADIRCGQRLMRYLGDLVVNGPSVVGQNGVPELRTDVVIPTLPGAPPGAATVSCLTGWRNILVKDGPVAFCAAIRAHRGVLVTDTTWRDAHQSILATRVRTIDLAKIAPLTSHALSNAFSLECWGGATFDVSLRFLKECPWDRLQTLRKLVPNIPFQMLLRGANAVGYTAYPDHIVYEFCATAVKYGMDIFRVFDSLNYVDNLKLGIDAVKKAGGVAEAAISYTGDVSDLTKTRYNLQYYLELTDKLVADGIHILGIKDMAGLLKPRAATMLIGAIRKKYPNLVIHLHTHDTAGTGIATYLAAVAAGVDIVDCAVDALSGQTSQPSMGAFVSSVDDTGISPAAVQTLSSYWDQMRLLYSPFESTMPPSDSSIYYTEMPGGQYTNLQFQSRQLGLGEQWSKIKIAYAQANRLCGDIVKVTPSSKVVGDLAQFMVAQNLSEQDVYEKCETLSFPQSVLEYYQGFLGQPPYGFPEPMRSKILNSRGLKAIEGRPGASMPPLNMNDLKAKLVEKYGEVRDVDVLSAALYPKVFEEYMDAVGLYGEVTQIPTQYFLRPMDVGEEFQFDLEKDGKRMIVKFVAVGPLEDITGRRDVFFTVDGEARVIDVPDKSGEDQKTGKATSIKRPKADPKAKNECSAPMAGLVVDVNVKEGALVKMGQPIAVLSAMKMETIITAPCDGVVGEIFVAGGDYIAANDLIVRIVE